MSLERRSADTHSGPALRAAAFGNRSTQRKIPFAQAEAGYLLAATPRSRCELAKLLHCKRAEVEWFGRAPNREYERALSSRWNDQCGVSESPKVITRAIQLRSKPPGARLGPPWTSTTSPSTL